MINEDDNEKTKEAVTKSSLLLYSWFKANSLK